MNDFYSWTPLHESKLVLGNRHTPPRSHLHLHYSSNFDVLKMRLNNPVSHSILALLAFFQSSIGILSGLVALPLLILRITSLTSLQYPKSRRLLECSKLASTIYVPFSFKSLSKYVCHLCLICASSNYSAYLHSQRLNLFWRFEQKDYLVCVQYS